MVSLDGIFWFQVVSFCVDVVQGQMFFLYHTFAFILIILSSMAFSSIRIPYINFNISLYW